jgi:dephospho-CoA kinase
MPSQDPSRCSRPDAIFVGFTGHIGAGKTTAAEYLRSRYGFQYERYSRVLQDWYAWASPDREALQQFGWEVMAGGRQVELNAHLIAGLGPLQSAAIDGLRHPIDFHSLSDAFGASFHLLFLDATAETRFRREPRFSTYDAFLAADSQPVEAHIDSLRPLAAATVPNEGSFASFYHRLDDLLQEYRMGERT